VISLSRVELNRSQPASVSRQRIGAIVKIPAAPGIRLLGCFCGCTCYSLGSFYKPGSLVTSEIREDVKIVMFAGAVSVSGA